MNKNQIPCQAVCNKLQIYYLPTELRWIHWLERVLVARKLQFKKVTIIPEGQWPKFKGAICNVPIDVVSTYNTLPRPADSNGLVTVKLKRKLEYMGHVYFEHVHPRLILKILQFLKKNNPLYYDIDINLSNIPDCLVLHNKENETVFSGLNLLDYVAPCELISVTIETTGCDSKKHNDSNKPVIHDA